MVLENWDKGANAVIVIIFILLFLSGSLQAFEYYKQSKAKNYCIEKDFEEAIPFLYGSYRCENRTLASDGVGFVSTHSVPFHLSDIKN